MKKFLKEIYPYIIIIIVVVLFRTFIATPVSVDGSSMYPTLRDKDILILNKLDNSYERYDVVVIKYGNTRLVKRIMGLPNEKIKCKNNILYINNKRISDMTDIKTYDFDLESLYNIETIPNGYYFVMGDNRTNSLDSRDKRVGLIKSEDIIGTVKLRLYPFNKIGTFK